LAAYRYTRIGMASRVELVAIRQRIANKLPTGGYVTITGHAGEGKSSIIAKLVSEYDHDKMPHHFIPFNPGPDHQVALLRDLMAQIILMYDLTDLYVASENRAVLSTSFTKLLADVAEKRKQLV
jgi:hypothetical protein